MGMGPTSLLYFAAFACGVCKSFKTFFSKVKILGCVITEGILASVVGDAFAQSHTPLNILGGSGIYP